MSHTTIRLNNGDAHGGKTRYPTSGAAPAYRTLTANPGETLASITLRAYGANTAELRSKIERANSTLTGTVRIPK